MRSLQRTAKLFSRNKFLTLASTCSFNRFAERHESLHRSTALTADSCHRPVDKISRIGSAGTQTLDPYFM